MIDAARRQLQQRQQVARQQELGVDIDLHDLLPAGVAGVGDRAPVAQQRGIVQNAIQAGKFPAEAGREVGVAVLGGGGQIHFYNGGLRSAAASISSYTASSLLPVRPSSSTVAPCAGVAECGAAADAVAGAGDQNSLAREQIGAGQVIGGDTEY